MLGVISIGIDPYVHLGPLTLAWHGITIALGIVLGWLVAAAEARRRGLEVDPLATIGVIVVAGALVGGRVYYLVEHGQLGSVDAWVSSRGFTFYGGFIAVALGIALYLWWRRLSVSYLDVVAIGLPLGYAIGRIGDFLNGEHYGPPTEFFLGVRNTHPDADVPSPDLAYHSGGLYEVIIGLAVFAIVWPLRRRFERPTSAVWAVIALFGVLRFFEFFVRSDSQELAVGLETAQWTSLALIAIAAVGAVATRRRRRRRPSFRR